MNSSSKSLNEAYIIFGSAFVFYISGQLVMPLAVPPSFAGAIWPPAGIALAAVLLWGYRVLPGFFLVELLINQEAYNLSLSTVSGHTLFWFVIQAFNAGVFRAWLGYWLIKKFIGFPNPLVYSRSIVAFFILGVLCSTLAPAWLSVYCLLARGEIYQTDFAYSFITWWMGDAIGIAIFTPLVFILFAHPRAIWLQRKFSVGIPLVVTLSIVFVGFLLSKNMEETRLKENCKEQAIQIANALDNAFQEHLEQLYAVSSFVRVAEDVTGEEFKIFTQRIMQWHDDIEVLAWLVKISPLEVEQKAGFAVKYYETQGVSLPTFVTGPLLDPEIKMALVSSRIGNKPLLTKVSSSADVSLDAKSFKIYLPIIAAGDHSIDNHSANRLKGFIVEELNMKAYTEEALEKFPLENHIIRIWENPQKSKLIDIYQSQEYANLPDPLNLTVRLPVQLAGQTWLLEISPDRNFLGENYSWHVSAVLFGGMLFASLMSIGLLIMTGQSALIRSEVEKRTEELRESNKKLAFREEQFRELVQAQSAIVWRADPKTLRYTFVSNEAETVLGYPVKQWLEDDFWFNTLYDDDKKWVTEYCRNISGQLRNHDIEYRMKSADARIVWVRNVINVAVEEDKVRELLGFMIDITDQKSVEEQLRLAATTFESLQGIYIMDKERNILRVNKAFTNITGYDAADILGSPPEFLYSVGGDNDLYAHVWQQLMEQEHYEGEMICCTKSGNIYHSWQAITAVKNAQEKITHFVAVFSDISEKKQAESQINNLAFYDPLTSLPNRRLLLDRLDQEIAVCKRHGRFGAIIFLDLDRFKVLNDSLGHHMGDELLIQVAYRLCSGLRDEDTAARLGGDEFVVLVHGNATLLKDAADQALVIAEKIKATLNETYFLKGYEHHFTPSIGITLFPENNDMSPDAIIQEADTAMYRSKAKGRNAISFFHPSMQEFADARLSLEKELRIGVEHKQFFLCFQPQVDRSGCIISAEALIRWAHPERGIVFPDDFIPVAEETNLIISLGNWVLRETCRQINVWCEAGIHMNKVAINVSSRQFRQTDFIEKIRTALNDYHITPGLLEVELTESVVIDDIEDTIIKMQVLKELGVSISIDDFGTGYSSLAYLKKLPIDTIKIDQNFIRDILQNANDAVIVETIIDMGKNLGLIVVAEGVETQEQYDFLMQKDCQVFQGYYFDSPVSADEFIHRHFS